MSEIIMRTLCCVYLCLFHFVVSTGHRESGYTCVFAKFVSWHQ